MNDGEPHPGSTSDVFRCVEGFENPLYRGLIHATTGVPHHNLCVGAGDKALAARCEIFVDFKSLESDLDGPRFVPYGVGPV